MAAADEQPRKRVEMGSFNGLVTNLDPFDVPPGMAVRMQNVTTVVPGQLTARKGHAAATFSNAISSTTDEVVAMYYYPAIIADWIVYTLDSGAIKAGRSPS